MKPSNIRSAKLLGVCGLLLMASALSTTLATITSDTTAKKPIRKPLVDPVLAAQMAEVEKLPTIEADAVPRRTSATYYSAQNLLWPPLPANFNNLPIWDLGDGHYLISDLDWDYSAPTATTSIMAMNSALMTMDSGGGMSMNEMQSGVPYLTITPTATNTVLITVFNDTDPGNYELWWTPMLADPNYPWTLQSVGLVGQTNFIVNMEAPTALFKAVVGSDADSDGVSNYMDGDPNNPAVGAFTITIDSPLTGNVFN